MKQPTTIHEDAYRRLKAMIMSNQVAPGERLVLRNIAKQLGISTMPVVEAIRRLEHDGLVTQIPKWGAFVKEWSREEQLEAYHIRRALEGEAARLFVIRADEQQKMQLIQLNEEFDKAAAKDPVAGLDADVALHLHIARSTGFPRLTHLIEVAKIALFMVMKFTQTSRQQRDLGREVGCHERLVRALLGTDPDLAVRLMWEHIGGVAQMLHGEEGDLASSGAGQRLSATN